MHTIFTVNKYRPAVETTLAFSTSRDARPQLAAVTKQRDNTKRSQRLRCYRRRHEYSKTRGSRVSGRRSIAPRREWSDRHFMNREPSLIDLTTRAASGGHGVASAASPGLRRRFRPTEVTSPATWRRARRKCAAYLAGLAPARARARRTARGARAAAPARPDSDIRKSARDH